MINLRNYLTVLGIIYTKDVLIIPDNAYNYLCDKFPEEDIDSWKHIDGWLHNVTGVNTFVFETDKNTQYVWNEEISEYE